MVTDHAHAWTVILRGLSVADNYSVEVRRCSGCGEFELVTGPYIENPWDR